MQNGKQRSRYGFLLLVSSVPNLNIKILVNDVIFGGDISAYLGVFDCDKLINVNEQRLTYFHLRVSEFLPSSYLLCHINRIVMFLSHHHWPEWMKWYNYWLCISRKQSYVSIYYCCLFKNKSNSNKVVITKPLKCTEIRCFVICLNAYILTHFNRIVLDEIILYDSAIIKLKT